MRTHGDPGFLGYGYVNVMDLTTTESAAEPPYYLTGVRDTGRITISGRWDGGDNSADLAQLLAGRQVVLTFPEPEQPEVPMLPARGARGILLSD